MKAGWVRFTGYVLLLAAAYVVTAKLGLSLAFTTQQVTTVWPPTGIALVALLILGYRYWPGVFVGALVANLLTNEPVGVAAGIAVGNTLEALTGAVLLQRVGRVRAANVLDTPRNVLKLLVLAGLVSTAVSASIGTLSLALGGLTSWSQYGSVWLVWWVGDMMGSLIFAPALLSLTNRHYMATWRRRWLRFGLMLAVSIGVAMVVFIYRPEAVSDFKPLPYMVFPVLIWAALEFRQIGVTALVLVMAMTAVWGTVSGLGPFAGGNPTETNLILLQVFLFTASVMSLVVAAVVAERERVTEALRQESAELRAVKLELEEARDRATEILAGVLDETSPRRRTRSIYGTGAGSHEPL
jgi:two-component system, NarL family, sensor histidine kinase FusK